MTRTIVPETQWNFPLDGFRSVRAAAIMIATGKRPQSRLTEAGIGRLVFDREPPVPYLEPMFECAFAQTGSADTDGHYVGQFDRNSIHHRLRNREFRIECFDHRKQLFLLAVRDTRWNTDQPGRNLAYELEIPMAIVGYKFRLSPIQRQVPFGRADLLRIPTNTQHVFNLRKIIDAFGPQIKNPDSVSEKAAAALTSRKTSGPQRIATLMNDVSVWAEVSPEDCKLQGQYIIEAQAVKVPFFAGLPITRTVLPTLTLSLRLPSPAWRIKTIDFYQQWSRQLSNDLAICTERL